jgi:tetratricopeptide (TPR) repeat protein
VCNITDEELTTQKMEQEQTVSKKWAIVAVVLTVIIGSISFGIARYEIETTKPNKEQTYTLANKYYDAGDFGNAAALYERYYTVFGVTDPAVRIDYGYALFKSGKPKEGLAMTQSVFSVDSENPVAQLNLAFMHYEAGNAKQAVDWLKKCAVNPRDTMIAGRARMALEQISQQLQR